MRKPVTLALFAVLAMSAAQAQNFTVENTEKTKALIDAAIEAHGGEAFLDGLQTLIVENRATNYAVDQSLGTEPPWDTAHNDGVEAIDLENSIFVNRFAGSGGGFEFDNGTIINGEESVRIDYRAGTITAIEEPDFETTSGTFARVTPLLLLRELKNREANAHFLGETTVDGNRYDVIGFSMTVGPAINLYFDRDTNLLRRSERVLPGFGLVEYHFDDYVVENGVPVNQAFALYAGGDINIKRVNKSVRINEPLDELLEVPAGLLPVPAAQADPFTRQELAEGIWLIGGNRTYAMFVDMGDYIFAAGGTAGIPDRIESLREVAGDKPIRYAMLTHHHSDHVLGVPAYEKEGAIVIAAAAHERIARQSAADGENLDVKPVKDSMVLEDGGRRIEIVDIGPTAHSEHLLVAWLPDEGILFEADSFAMPQVGPVPPAVSTTRSFAKIIADKGWSVKRFVSAHSATPGTPEDLEHALTKETFEAAR